MFRDNARMVALQLRLFAHAVRLPRLLRGERLEQHAIARRAAGGEAAPAPSSWPRRANVARCSRCG